MLNRIWFKKFAICNLPCLPAGRQFVIAAILLVLPLAAHADNFSDAAKDYIYGDYQDSLNKAQAFKRDPQGMYLMGLNNLKLGDYPKARECFKAVTAAGSSSMFTDQARIKIADTYFLEKNYPVAKKEYLNLQGSPVANNFLSLIYLRLAQIAAKEGNWQEKADYTNKIKAQFPKSAEMKYIEVLEAHGDFFTVQVGAFSSIDNAEAIRKDLKGRYETYVVKDVRPSLTIYKVRVGHFTQRAAAEAVCAKMLNEGFPAIVYP